ncbi:MAG: hypothetical protein LH619_09430, partial [Chitinophagaceae bacterium]|nr:hypothetical protein [Chitinophagaceae bacterium]
PGKICSAELPNPEVCDPSLPQGRLHRRCHKKPQLATKKYFNHSIALNSSTSPSTLRKTDIGIKVDSL